MASYKKQLAAHVSWAQTEDRTARTAPARRGFRDKITRQIREQFPNLNDAEVEVRAEHARKAHYLRMAARSAEVRRSRVAARGR